MNLIQNLELMLNQYKQILADYDEASIEVFKLECQKSLHETGTIESKDDVISGMALNSPILSHIPKSITNKINSTVENIALEYLQFLRPSKIDIKEIESKIEASCKVVTDSFEKKKQIELMLTQLNEHEKFIIEKIYFDGYGLTKTKKLFNNKFPDFRMESKNSIRNTKFEALQKMATRLKK